MSPEISDRRHTSCMIMYYYGNSPLCNSSMVSLYRSGNWSYKNCLMMDVLPTLAAPIITTRLRIFIIVLPLAPLLLLLQVDSPPIEDSRMRSCCWPGIVCFLSLKNREPMFRRRQWRWYTIFYGHVAAAQNNERFEFADFVSIWPLNRQ